MLVCLSVGLTVGYELSHPLGVPVFLSMTLGAVMGQVIPSVVAENTPLRLARAVLWTPLPFCALLPLALWLHPHRILSMCLLGLVTAMVFVLARFGQIWLITGIMMFVASMVGSVVTIPLALCGRIFLLVIATAAAVLVAWLVLCYPMPREELRRTQRAFLVEARQIAEAASLALAPDADRATAIRRMRRALRRLNITTLTIDSHLAQPAVAADPHQAELLHQYLFDAELALRGIGQAVQQMASRHVPARLREAMVVGLVIARDTHLGRAEALRPAAELIRQQAGAGQEGMSEEEAEVRALARRVGDQLDAFAAALACWLSLGSNSSTARARVPFQGTVVLVQNRPAGTAQVAQRVATAQGASGWRRVAPYLRTPLQAAVATAIVCPITYAIDGAHFYWGVVGVLIAFFGASTTPDRLRKLAHRLLGTAVGAVLGIGVLHLIGPGHIYQTLAFIVVAFSLGAWMQRQYAYLIVGLVAALTQLYGMTTPWHSMDWLLTKRLIDNGLGMVVASACAVVIFPVSTRKIAREAKRGYLSALEQLIAQVAEHWRDPEAPVRLRGAARGVDAALFQVDSVLRPLVGMPLGVRGRRNDNFLALLGTATQHAHVLAAAADIDICLATALRTQVEQIIEVFTDSLHALQQQVSTGQHGGTWTRVSPMIRETESLLNTPTGPRVERLHVALRELSALDEVLANLADNLGMSIIITPQPAATARTAATTSSGTAHITPPMTAQGHGHHRAGWAASPSQPTGTADAPAGQQPTFAPRLPQNAATVTVSGTLRCPLHRDGCEAWITVVTGQGKRWTQARAANGLYQITGLPPGAYTLIASASRHAPHAQFLLVNRASQQVRHDIELHPTR
ncbi:FUSC family protein [Streptomyces sp. NPDC001982]|uniref:FUSC family protein n=1 Tax=Streptomyces sp. NPDC001982 TaxID=3154405 RepID=UPI00331D5123